MASSTKVTPLWLEQLKDLTRHTSAMIGAALIIFLVLVAIFADVLYSIEPLVEHRCAERCAVSVAEGEGQPSDSCYAECIDVEAHYFSEPAHIYPDTEASLVPPGTEFHPFGTDSIGRDIFAQVVHGARYTLLVVLISVTLGFLTGGLLGLVSGYFGGAVDNGIMRILDIVLAIPYLLLAMVIAFVFKLALGFSDAGPGTFVLILTIWIVSIPRFARIMRGQVLAEKNREYVQASRALGASDLRLIFRVILPNAWAPMIVQATLALAEAIITAAALGFLALGAPEGAAEWGKILAENQKDGQEFPWIVLFPGFAIILAVLGFNLLGDGLRDTLDPRLKRS